MHTRGPAPNGIQAPRGGGGASGRKRSGLKASGSMNDCGVAVELGERDAQERAFRNEPPTQAHVLSGAAVQQRAGGRVQAHGLLERGREPGQLRQIVRCGLSALQHLRQFPVGAVRGVGVLGQQPAPPQQCGGRRLVPRLKTHDALVEHFRFAQRLARVVVAQREQACQQVVSGRGVCGLLPGLDVPVHQLAQHGQGLALGGLAGQGQPVGQGEGQEHLAHRGFAQHPGWRGSPLVCRRAWRGG